jgi:hypothetical protein
MQFVIAAPELITAAAADLTGIFSTITEANAVAAAPTMGVLAAGADEVSATIATLFGEHAQAYQALSTQAAAFHAQFVKTVNAAASAYASSEAANASPMQTALNVLNAPTQALLDRPLIGNGTTRRRRGATAGPAGYWAATVVTAVPAETGHPAVTAVTRCYSATAGMAGPVGPRGSSANPAATAAPVGESGAAAVAAATAAVRGCSVTVGRAAPVAPP